MKFSASSPAHAKTIDKEQRFEFNNPLPCVGRWIGRPDLIRILTNKPVLLAMKLTSILLLIACLQVNAKGFGQGTVTISVKNVMVTEVFKEIEKQTSFRFLYRDELVKRAGLVSVTVKDASVQEVLDECFARKPLDYKIFKETIVISEKAALANKGGGNAIIEPTIDVTGRVLNEQGKPVEGVTVTIKNTNKATTTNTNGEFFLSSVEQDAVLVFTSVNMETFELRVSGKTEIVVNLKAKVSELGGVEVVVNTGYEQMAKERATGSYSKLDSVAYHRRAGLNIMERLDGTVNGLVFNKKGGPAPLQIRGISSVGTTGGSLLEPLVVVDNFPFYGDINTLNPNDIVDITVLKDAAAASIWGTRAGNGVIVITTKKARFNQPLRITVSSNVTMNEEPDLYYFPQMSSRDFIEAEKFLFVNGFYNDYLPYPQYVIMSPVVQILNRERNGEITSQQAEDQINLLKGQDVREDFRKYVFRKGISQQHYLNFSGGNNIINYTLSTGFNSSSPSVKGLKSNTQYTINSMNSFRPVRNLELQAGINFSKGKNDNSNFRYPLAPGGLVNYRSQLYPYARLVDDEGRPAAVPRDYDLSYIDMVAADGRFLDWYYRPLDEIRLADNTIEQQFVKLNFGAKYKITDWLQAEVLYQHISQKSTKRDYYSEKTYYARDLINRFSQDNGAINYIIPNGGILDVGSGTSSSQNLRGQITINKQWHGRHSISGLIAGEISENKGYFAGNRFYGYNSQTSNYTDRLDYLTYYPIYSRLFGETEQIPQGNVVNEAPQNRFVSVLGNLSYVYNGRYTLYMSARRDGANVFGVNTNNKWKPLWSAGVSWDISKEPFYKSNWLNYLRARAALGYMGNVDNSLSGLPTIVYSAFPASYTGLPIASVDDAPNPDLRWEQVRTFNIGMDFSMFKNRISGSIEWFQKKSENLISRTLIDPTTGISSYIVNIASLKGSGFEIQLNSNNIIGTFQWTTGIALSYNKTIVSDFYNGGFKASDYLNYGINPLEGQIAWGISSYRWAGLDPSNGDPQGFFGKEISKDYYSISEDSLKNQVFHGSSIPLYSGFLMNTFSWKNISLSANITYRFDYYFRKPSILYSALYENWIGHPDYGRRWVNPGDELITNVPSMTYPADAYRDNFYANSEVNVEKGDHIRLQDIRLNYNLQIKNKETSVIRNCQIYVYCNNLNIMLWRANDSGLDPDFTGGSSGVILPPVRSWTLGVNFNL